MEIFEGTDPGSQIRREKMEREAVFAIKVPKLPGEGTVKFFEARGGVNLFEAQARESRKYLNEIKIKTAER